MIFYNLRVDDSAGGHSSSMGITCLNVSKSWLTMNIFYMIIFCTLSVIKCWSYRNTQVFFIRRHTWPNQYFGAHLDSILCKFLFGLPSQLSIWLPLMSLKSTCVQNYKHCVFDDGVREIWHSYLLFCFLNIVLLNVVNIKVVHIISFTLKSKITIIPNSDEN